MAQSRTLMSLPTDDHMVSTIPSIVPNNPDAVIVPISGKCPADITVIKALAIKKTPISGLNPTSGTITAPAKPVRAEPNPNVNI